jgi:hypothetical protein
MNNFRLGQERVGLATIFKFDTIPKDEACQIAPILLGLKCWMEDNPVETEKS